MRIHAVCKHCEGHVLLSDIYSSRQPAALCPRCRAPVASPSGAAIAREAERALNILAHAISDLSRDPSTHLRLDDDSVLLPLREVLASTSPRRRAHQRAAH